MSIKVENLTKVFGQQFAVNGISFEVNKGEIAGFLGPNGAGKSTTMKIIATLIPPTSGSVTVADMNPATRPTEVRRRIGYLPENNPLYVEMFVHEYLRFVGSLFGMRGKTLTGRVAEVVELFGLGREQNKQIETLSKGYKQRVGLAHAFIHDPEVLILDEPTSGLDPNQLVEIRNLIKEISKNKTVLFSTHIMQEVSAICDRAIVINQGKIVADDSLANLMSRKGTDVLIVEFENEIALDLLSGISGVASIQNLGSNKFKVYSDGQSDIRSEIFRFAADSKTALIGLQQEETSLEGLFRELTLEKQQ